MLTFYGHFSGFGSYPIVCRALTAHLDAVGIEHRIVDIRAPKHTWRPAEHGPALLFGFPSWWHELPEQHLARVGYHVCDVTPVPPDWVGALGYADVLLTASRWCAEVYKDSGARIQPVVVPHGVPANMPLSARRGPVVADFLHFCSSSRPDRKGTVELLEAFDRLGRGTLRVVTDSPEVLGRVKQHRRENDIFVETLWMATQAAQVARFDEARFVVQPSRAEGYGMIVQDALAAGRPVVATTCTGHAMSLVDEGGSVVAGVVEVPTGELDRCSGGFAPRLEVDDLVKALSFAMDHADELERDAQQAASAYRDKHSWSQALSSLSAVLDPVLF